MGDVDKTIKNDKNKKDNKKEQQQQVDIADITKQCIAEDCKKKITRLDFCDDHFKWYKEGLIDKKGQKPRDFNTKYQSYLKKNKNKAVS